MTNTTLTQALAYFMSMCRNLRHDEKQPEKTEGIRLGRAYGYLAALRELELITEAQFYLLCDLATSASIYAGRPCPHRNNAGPQMPPGVWLTRTYPVQLELAEVAADECAEQVSTPAPRRQLRLLCLLVNKGFSVDLVPAATLRAMPPRVDRLGKWGNADIVRTHLRETHARAPSAEVLARLQRHGKAGALRADESPRRHSATV